MRIISLSTERPKPVKDLWIRRQNSPWKRDSYDQTIPPGVLVKANTVRLQK